MDKRMFKKEGEELQQYLAFKRRGHKVPAKKGRGSYNRQEFKRGFRAQVQPYDDYMGMS